MVLPFFAVAFEIMACSFILKSLQVENSTKESLNNFLNENEEQMNKYTKCLSGLKQSMRDKGGEENLVMFLSGMGGTGKSEVIKAFVYFAKHINYVFGWNYDTDVIKMTAITGSAAFRIPNGKRYIVKHVSC